MFDLLCAALYHPAHSFACKDRMSCQELYEKARAGTTWWRRCLTSFASHAGPTLALCQAPVLTAFGQAPQAWTWRRPD